MDNFENDRYEDIVNKLRAVNGESLPEEIEREAEYQELIKKVESHERIIAALTSRVYNLEVRNSMNQAPVYQSSPVQYAPAPQVQTYYGPGGNKLKSRDKDFRKSSKLEEYMGTYGMSLLASVIAIIAVISCGVLLWDKVSNLEKFIAITLVGAVMTSLGVYAQRKKGIWAANFFIGTGEMILLTVFIMGNRVLGIYNVEIELTLMGIWVLIAGFMFFAIRRSYIPIIQNVGLLVVAAFWAPSLQQDVMFAWLLAGNCIGLVGISKALDCMLYEKRSDAYNPDDLLARIRDICLFITCLIPSLLVMTCGYWYVAAPIILMMIIIRNHPVMDCATSIMVALLSIQIIQELNLNSGWESLAVTVTVIALYCLGSSTSERSVSPVLVSGLYAALYPVAIIPVGILAGVCAFNRRCKGNKMQAVSTALLAMSILEVPKIMAVDSDGVYNIFRAVLMIIPMLAIMMDTESAVARYIAVVVSAFGACVSFIDLFGADFGQSIVIICVTVVLFGMTLKKFRADKDESSKALKAYMVTGSIVYFACMILMQLSTRRHAVIITLGMVAFALFQSTMAFNVMRNSKAMMVLSGLKLNILLFALMGLYEIDANGIVISGCSIMIASACTLIGMMFRVKALRIYGICVNFIIAAKIVIIDLSSENGAVRIVALILISAVCFGLSVAYKKISQTIVEPEKEPRLTWGSFLNKGKHGE